jgi:hypothetical protein
VLACERDLRPRASPPAAPSNRRDRTVRSAMTPGRVHGYCGSHTVRRCRSVAADRRLPSRPVRDRFTESRAAETKPRVHRTSHGERGPGGRLSSLARLIARFASRGERPFGLKRRSAHLRARYVTSGRAALVSRGSVTTWPPAFGQARAQCQCAPSRPTPVRQGTAPPIPWLPRGCRRDPGPQAQAGRAIEGRGGRSGVTSVWVVPTTVALMLVGSTTSQTRKRHHDGRGSEDDGCRRRCADA